MGRRIIENPNDCPLTHAMNIIGGKWKPLIIYLLSKGTLRFGKIYTFLPTISKKVLTEQLKELAADGIIFRERFAEVPPRVEYTLSEKGMELMPILDSISKWSQNMMTEVHFKKP